MSRYYLTAFAAFTLLRSAAAGGSCTITNDMEGVGQTASPPTCQTMGDGHYSFVLDLTGACVPTGDGGSAMDGCVNSNSIVIYDNTCKALGHYSLGDDLPNNCGTPYVINEPWLPYQLTVQDINEDLGRGYFKFAYANGLYSIGNNHCICSNISGKSLQAEQVCGCSFPINGEPPKIKGRSPVSE